MHTVTKATVKNGRIVMSGMYDNSYGEQRAWRHFSNYVPKTMQPLWSSSALGKFGTKSEYMKLAKAYSKTPLKMYKNTSKNIKKHAKC